MNGGGVEVIGKVGGEGDDGGGFPGEVVVVGKKVRGKPVVRIWSHGRRRREGRGKKKWKNRSEEEEDEEEGFNNGMEGDENGCVISDLKEEKWRGPNKRSEIENVDDSVCFLFKVSGLLWDSSKYKKERERGFPKKWNHWTVVHTFVFSSKLTAICPFSNFFSLTFSFSFLLHIFQKNQFISTLTSV